MLKTFGLAAATLLFLTTADTSLGAPGGAMTGGFDGHAVVAPWFETSGRATRPGLIAVRGMRLLTRNAAVR